MRTGFMRVVLLAALPALAQEGATIVHPGDLASTYSSVLNEVKKEGLQVETASQDAGIRTEMVVTGKYRQTGSHLEITFISDSATQTTVKVAWLEQKRYKALNTESWSEPKVNEQQSRAETDKLKGSLGW